MNDPVVNFLSTFKNPVLEKLKDIKDEVNHFFNNGLSEYLDSQYRKLNFTKTFLHRQDNTPFYDLFFPIDLAHKNDTIAVQNLEDVFQKSNCITIVGRAGSGKSMLMKHFFLSSVNNGYRIPIYIELRRLSEKKVSIFDFLLQYVIENELAPNKGIFKRLLKQGIFLFLLDGYDEMYSENKQRIISDIEKFIDTYNLNRFLITSRPGANVEMLPRFINTNIKKLSNQQIKDFIKQQVQLWDKEKDFSDKIIGNIFSSDNSDYMDFVKNPLLLSMYILSFENNPEIPKKKHRFYANVFNTLCIRHDSVSKHGWVHEKKSGLSYDEIEQILKTFSFLSYFNGNSEFELDQLKELLNKIKEKQPSLNFETNKLIEDLEVALSLLIRDGLKYRFPHRSLQEYFTAAFIKEKPVSLKEEIYKNKFPNRPTFIFDNSSNFWSLCEEMDKIYFQRFFLIHYLDKIFNYELKSRKDKIKDTFKYLNNIEYKMTFSDREKNGIFYFEGGSRLANISEQILDYVGISTFFKFDLSFDKSLINKINIDKKSHSNQAIGIAINHFYQNYHLFDISKSEIETKILEFRSEVTKKLNELKKELEKAKKTDQNILDLI